MMDDSLALCLSPQSFHNINKDSDIFNNINKQFWECWWVCLSDWQEEESDERAGKGSQALQGCLQNVSVSI
jgi:hypothetical protein